VRFAHQSVEPPMHRSIYVLLRCERLLNHRNTDGKIADQSLRESVAISQVSYTSRTHPDLTIRTLPDEDFEGQIKCQERGRNHQGRAALWIAKDQHVGLLHREANSFCLSTVINMGKEA